MRKDMLKNFFSPKTDYVKVEDKNRFYYMLQQMQANRWKITAIVLGLFFFIILGINAGVFMGASINEDWKEMLLILLGAFVGNLNKVVDYWFNSEDRDKMLIQKVDEEDGQSLSVAGEFPASKKETAMPDFRSPKAEAKPEAKAEYAPAQEEIQEEIQEAPAAAARIEIDEDGDGSADGWDDDGDGAIDEYFPHRNCEHEWGDADGDGYEECQKCGLLRSQAENQ